MRLACVECRQNKTRGIALGAGLFCVCLMANMSAQAQVATSIRASASDTTSRLVNAEEGLSIAQAAREQTEFGNGTLDCSHVVHQIYLNAGLEYPYASSFDIYAGDENFQRVGNPQAGDLIVWPGHLGIVLDVAEHSFYSLVSTGLQAQNYEEGYWKLRGKPRFYRYKIGGADITSAAGTQASGQRVSNLATPSRTTAVVVGPSSAGSSTSNLLPKTVSARTPMIYGPPAPPLAVPPATAFVVPSSIMITAGNKSPTRNEVAEGISELSSAAGGVLRTDEPLRISLPVLIVEHFTVERVDTKHEHGWVHMQIDSKVSIAGGAAHVKRRRENVRWELRRTGSGWEAVAPSDRTFVPQDVAVKNLAAQLARLTGSEAPATHQGIVLRQESQLANLLSVLLESK